MYLKSLICALALTVSMTSFAAQTGKYFDRAIIVIFENTSYSDAVKQPFFKTLAERGANFTNFFALARPSQPNYFALTSGSTHGVSSNGVVNLNVSNIVDLLEAKGVSWKAYVEDYPGNCFTGATNAGYARKHNPFISYLSVQKNPARCAKIVNSNQFDVDAASGNLPDYSFFVPNDKNSGHDTNVAYADSWYSKKFVKYVSDAKFMENTVLISTFDEAAHLNPRNQIYTSILGRTVKPGAYSTQLTLYSLLRLIEENWDLGNLGREDARTTPIPNIWK